VLEKGTKEESSGGFFIKTFQEACQNISGEKNKKYQQF
jgi:hypothetical protein